MKIYVIRHGETGNNKDNIMNGRNDEDINENGIRQAEQAAGKVKNLDIDLLFVSPMKRTAHTAEIVNVNNLPVIYDERLIERDSGELTGVSLEGDFREDYWNYFNDNFNCESVKELFARVHPFIDEVIEKYKDKNILVVTHRGVGRAFYFYFNEMVPDGKILNVGIMDNCEIFEYNI